MTLLLLLLSPPDIWHDANALTLISIAVAIVFGIAGFSVGIFAAIYPVRRQRRKLEYWRVSDAPIVTVHETMGKKIQVLLNGKSSEQIRLYVIEVKNRENTVRSEDYFEPLTFEFDEEVIGAEILDTWPKNLIKISDRGSFLKLESKSVQLPSFPLNHGESIRLSVLLKGESKLTVRGRIDGAITEFDPEQTVPVTHDSRLSLGKATVIGFLMLLLGCTIFFLIVSNTVLINFSPIGTITIVASRSGSSRISYETPSLLLVFLLFVSFTLFSGGISLLVSALIIYLKRYIKSLGYKKP